MMIATANGLLALSIPVEGGRNQRTIYRDVRIDYRGDWQVRHWRSIFSAYGKSPWFFQYAEGLEALYRHRDSFLVDWNFRCLEWVCAALGLPAAAPLCTACHIRDDRGAVFPAGDRERSSETLSGSVVDSLPDVPAASRSVLDLKDRVKPAYFQDTELGPFPRYPQVFGERWGFIPNLSVVDLVLCCGPGSISLLQAMTYPSGD